MKRNPRNAIAPAAKPRQLNLLDSMPGAKVVRAYENRVSQFGSAGVKKGEDPYTPHCVVNPLAERVEPLRDPVFDPRCGFDALATRQSGAL